MMMHLMENFKTIYIGLFLLIIGSACKIEAPNDRGASGYPDVKIAGAMKNVMWKGELGGIIRLDTITNKVGLYGLGPLSDLKGELMIKDGSILASKVVSDTSMIVQQSDKSTAPFFVYANVQEWETIDLPAEIKQIKDLEIYIVLL